MRTKILKQNSSNILTLNGILPYIAWLTASLSVVGSLFFSEIMHLPPCVLCWYQRIAIYPLVLIIGTGIILRDARMKWYALPLCLIGLVISSYHNLLYYGFIPESITPCSEGVPCNAVQIEWLGFITIPLMGLAAFIVITVCMLFYKSEED
ncbi:MAG TPA: disulfide bond formation protein B [Pyrinomonadaceae bacterium]|nr:disulfide bond formation protein B [Pyrinomonadaceae bacterium]